jgi:hypothetical protein
MDTPGERGITIWTRGEATGIESSTSNNPTQPGTPVPEGSGTAADDRLIASMEPDEIDGGAGIDTVVFSALSSSYAVRVTSEGVVELVSTDGTKSLSNVEYLEFSDGVARNVMDVIPQARLESEPYAAKVKAYFLTSLGRAPSAEELSTFTDTLSKSNGSVWRDATGVGGPTNTDSLVGYLFSRDEFQASVLGKDNETIVTEMFERMLGEVPSEETYQFYVDKLDAGAMKVRGLANALLNDFSLMPRADNVLAQPGKWVTDFYEDLTPGAYVGYLENLELVGVNVLNYADGILTA